MPSVDVKKVEKPWGHELIFAHTSQYVGKILFIKKGEALSRQYHREKDETIHVLEGRLRLEVGPAENVQTINMDEGRSFHVTPGTIHRFVADSDVTLAEVSTPQLDDVVRLEDRYGRVADEA